MRPWSCSRPIVTVVQLVYDMHPQPERTMDPARFAEARRAAAMLRRYQRYEALRPFTCPENVDHYLLEPFAIAGDVLLVCPTCGFADLVVPEALPELSARLSRAAAFWKGIPG